MLRRSFFKCERLWVCAARKNASWRDSTSVRSWCTYVLSGTEGEILAEVGCGRNSQNLSVCCEAESRLRSAWPKSMAWTCCLRRLAQMVQISSRTSGERPLRYLRNCDGFRSSISSRESCLTRCSREADKQRTICVLDVHRNRAPLETRSQFILG